MANGSHYIQAIDLLLDAELHNKQTQRDNHVALAISELVAPFDIDPRSRRLAGAFRSTRTIDSEEAADAQADVFKERFPQLGRLDNAQLKAFIKKLDDSMSGPDSLLYRERTKLSTISTIVRPLTTKWLERWKTQRIDGFSYVESLSRVEKLLAREVTDLQSFNLWAEEVYDLFTDLVIFRPNPLDRIGSQARRPSGMISEGNERIYRKNWSDFKAEYGHELVRRAEEIANGRSDYAFNTAYRPQLRSVDFDYGMPQNFSKVERPESSTAAKPENALTSFALYKVSIESALIDQGAASKTWTSKESLKSEIKRFLNVVAGTWGEGGQSIHATFTFDSNGGETTIKVPNKTPDEAAESVIKLLDLAD